LKGHLLENRVVIWSIEDSRAIFKQSFYGKPLGIPKPKGADFNAPLILDLMEALYLIGKKKLTIYDVAGKKVTQRKLMDICRSQYADFDDKYLVYCDLRGRGYIVTPGIKFGCDFAVYEKGPGIDHAPYLIQVSKPKERLTATMVVLQGRLATTVRKQFTIAVPDVSSRRVGYVSFDWWRA